MTGGPAVHGKNNSADVNKMPAQYSDAGGKGGMVEAMCSVFAVRVLMCVHVLDVCTFALAVGAVRPKVPTNYDLCTCTHTRTHTII